MSTVSGYASKADKDKGSKKFSSLDINNLYKGKSLENTKTVEPVKHGLQTLGKIGAGRRVPPPTNLPSLKSETNNKATSSNVSSTVSTSSGVSQSGWAKKDQENTTLIQNTSNSSTGEQQPSSQSLAEPINGQLTDSSNSAQSNVNVNNTSQSKTWTSVNEQQQQQQQQNTIDTTPTKSSANSSNKISSFFSQDFPSLDGGTVTNVPKSNSENYGPGPNLRPQTGNWLNKQQSSQQLINQTINQQQQQQLNNSQQGNQQPNNGNYANGQSQQDDSDTQQQRAYNTGQQQQAPRNNSNGYNRNQNYPQRYNNPNNNGQFKNQQYQSNQRQYDNRNRQQNRLREDMPERAKVAILSEKELQGFDELLDDTKLEDWTKTKNQIDFNAKLNFSEDEDNRSLNEYDDKEQDPRDEKIREEVHDKATISQSNEQHSNSRYRRDYQNPRPHQSYNNSKFERNSNYLPSTSQQQQPQQIQPPKFDNLDEKRMKSKSDLNERRREDDERKYSQQSIKEKPVDQQPQQQSTNYKMPSSNRNQDEMMSSNQHSNNYNNRQFQQSLPPRFQKMQQNTNNSSYNRYDANSRNQQQSMDKDRKRIDGPLSQDDNDGYQNKRLMNRQSNWRTNTEFSKSQEKPSQQQQPPAPQQQLNEQVKKEVEPEKKTSELSKPIESESSKVELDLKSSTSSNNQLISSSNSSNLIKKQDDKLIQREENVGGGDSLNNDLVANLAKNASQLSINDKKSGTVTTVSSDNKQTTQDDQPQTTVKPSTTVDKPVGSSKPLNASQESKHADLNQQNKQEQNSSYKNQRGGYDNRSHYRPDDYRMHSRDYRNNRLPSQIENRGIDKNVNKNMNKKHEYVDDYRGRDYNQMNRPRDKYEPKKDDKYAKINQQPSHPPKESLQKPIQTSANKGNFIDNLKTNRRPNDKDYQESYQKSSSMNDKELNSSQNDKKQSMNQVRMNKDRKPEQVSDESASSGFSVNKKQPKYSGQPTKSTNQHHDDLGDKNRQQRDVNKPQKMSSYERKNDTQPIRNQRKLSQDEVEKVIQKSGQDEEAKKKEMVDKSKSSKNEMLSKTQKMNNNNSRPIKPPTNQPSNRYYRDNYRDSYNNRNYDYYHSIDDSYAKSRRNNSNSNNGRFSQKEDLSTRNSSNSKSHNLLTKNGLIINSSNINKSNKVSPKNEKCDLKNDSINDSVNDSSCRQIKVSLDQSVNQKQCSVNNSTNSNGINKQTTLSGSSKSSSFDQQDSGIDLMSDQLASNASSQRSSPSSNAGKTNNSPSIVSISCVSSSTTTTSSVNNLISTTANKSSIRTGDLAGNKKLNVDELSSSKTVCNVIFENSKLKVPDTALDKFSNKLDSKLDIKEQNKPELELTSSLHYADKDKNETVDNKIEFSFNSAKPTTTNVSKVVGASRNVVMTSAGDQCQISPSTDDLNMKIASVKNVWESMPSMPSVLEINNEDSNQLDHHKYDETKLRSPVRSVDQSAAVHVLSNNMNSSNNGNSSAFVNMNMKQISNEELKKSHQLYQQHAANQMHQSIGQHPVLISTSPPNLMNHMNNPNLDNVRRVQNQYQLSNMQRISSPSNLIYNSQTQVGPGVPHQNAANNIYQQFANQMKNMPQNPQLMPQFANHFAATQHILQQRNQVIGQPQNMQFVQQVAPQSLSGPPNPMNTAPQLTNAPPNSNIQSGPPQNMQFVQPSQVNLHQQNHLASHLIKQHVVQAPPNAFYQNQSVPQQSTLQPQLNAFYQNLPPNAPKPGPYAPHQQLQQHHLGQQLGGQVPQQQHHVQPQPTQQQFNYHMQPPAQQFNLINAQNTQLAANAQNYARNAPKRFI